MMCRKDVDAVLNKLETIQDPPEMRRLLQQADACRTCPEQDLLGGNIEECRCLLRFRTDLQNSLNHMLGGQDNLPHRKESN